MPDNQFKIALEAINPASDLKMIYRSSENTLLTNIIATNYGDQTPSISNFHDYYDNIPSDTRLASLHGFNSKNFHGYVDTVGNYKTSSEESEKLILKGSFPSFHSNIATIERPGNYYIQRILYSSGDGSYIIIRKKNPDDTWTDITLSRSNFRDGVIPTALIFELQAGGGGGGGSNRSVDGSGAGGGGYICGVIKFTEDVNTFYFTIGAGGAGGSIGANGSNGGDSYISDVENPDFGSTINNYAICYGGEHGYISNSSYGQGGGYRWNQNRSQALIYCYIYESSNSFGLTGGNGSPGNTKNDGANINLNKFYLTSTFPYLNESYNSITHSAMYGGTSGNGSSSNGGGAGGAAVFGPGGNGGGGKQNGFAPVSGSGGGGGGARYDANIGASGHVGGAGKPGLIKFWY